MNPDLIKIRRSKLFKKLPDRVFKRIEPLLRVRAFGRGETILDLSQPHDLTQSFGYVVTGRVALFDASGEPLGLTMKDEFFPARTFSLFQKPVLKLVAAAPETLLVFLPRDILSTLAGASSELSELLEGIYESVFERSRLIVGDPEAAQAIKEMLSPQERDRTIASWVHSLEIRRSRWIDEKRTRLQQIIWTRWLWFWGLIAFALISFETFARLGFAKGGARSLFLSGSVPEQIVINHGFGFAVHGLAVAFLWLSLIAPIGKRWGLSATRQAFAQQTHALFGLLAFGLMTLSLLMEWPQRGLAWMGWGGLLLATLSGFLLGLLRSMLPESNAGDLLERDVIERWRDKMREKAAMILNQDQEVYGHATHLMTSHAMPHFWAHVFAGPFLWMRGLRVTNFLQGKGLSPRLARLATHHLKEEFRLTEKTRLLNQSAIWQKKILAIHRPLGWLVVGLLTAQFILLKFS